MENQLDQGHGEAPQRAHASITDFTQNPPAKRRVRFLALLIDSAVMSLCTVPLGVFLELVEEEKLPVVVQGVLGSVYMAFGIVMMFVLVLTPLQRYGQTVGKRLLKIRVLNKEKKPEAFSYLSLFFRENFLKAFSMLTIGLSGKEKRMVHDLLVGTCVVEVKERKPLMDLFKKKSLK